MINSLLNNAIYRFNSEDIKFNNLISLIYKMILCKFFDINNLKVKYLS